MKITAHNFLSWKDLEFNLSKGVTLIDGWNNDDGTSEGSGKSAIVNALCFGLFGKLPKDAKVDEVVRQGEKSCVVVIELNDYKIIRSRKPNELFMEKSDGTRIKGKDAKETQRLIEEVVGFSFETFLQTIYFAQNYNKKFITSSQEDKGRILSEVQDLSIFDRARVEAKDREGSTSRELAQDEYRRLSLDKDTDHVKEKIRQLKSFAEREAKKRNNKKVRLSGELADIFKEINSIKKVDVGLLEEDKEKLLNELDQVEEKVSTYNKSQLKKRNIEDKLEDSKRELNSLLRDNPENCPKCGSKMDISHVEKLTNEVMDNISGLELELMDFKLPEEPQSTRRIRSVVRDIDSEIRKSNEVENRLVRLSGKREVVEQQIKEVNNEEIEDVSSDIENLEEHLKNIVVEKDSLQNIINDKSDRVKRLGMLKIGYKEIKSFVFNTLLNELSHKANTYLAELFEIPISIKFTNNNMKIGTSVTIDGVERGLGLLSGGQFRRVSLAVDLSLSDIINSRKGSKINVLILDEYFKDLSEQSMEKCLKLLERLGKSVVLIEHNSIFKSIVDNTFEVELTEGVSRVKGN